MTISYPDNPPPDPGFSRAQLQIQNVAPSSTNPANMKKHRSHLGAARWTGSLVVEDMDESQAPAWKAWITSMSGHTGTFKLGDPGYPGPQGNVNSVGTVTAANDGGNFVEAKGYAANTTVFQVGDQVEIDGNLYQIIYEDFVTDANGQGIFYVAPRLRSDFLGGKNINYNNPQGTFRLDQAVSQWDAEKILTMLEFPIIEKVK